MDESNGLDLSSKRKLGEILMLKFDKKFFEEEERDGFVIEPLMKNAWAAELQVLERVDQICQEHNISYYADWGTLLGTIRHKGFIPWDDDIDICMRREDLERFARVMEDYEDELIFCNIYNTPDWGAHAARVSTKNFFVVDRDQIKDQMGFPFPAGIDIFTLDRVPDDKMLEKEQIDLMQTISSIREVREWIKENGDKSQEARLMKKEYIGLLRGLERNCHMKFSQEDPTEQELLILSEEIAGAYNGEDSAYITQMNCLGCGMDYYIPQSVYEKTVRMPFENTTIPVPEEYDILLRKKYGDDYMTPQKNNPGHEYPFYKKLIEDVCENRQHDDFEMEKNYIVKISSKFYSNYLNRDVETKCNFTEEFFNKNKEKGEEYLRVLAAQMEILEEIKRLCKAHNMNIFAICQTLKDAVEHHAPADKTERVTLGMMREDYNKFMLILQEELDAWFDYRNLYANSDHDSLALHVITDSYLCSEREYKERFHGCCDIVGIEIYPIDYVSEDISKEETRNTIVEKIFTMVDAIPNYPPYTEKIMKLAEEWKSVLQLSINLQGNLKREFLKAADMYLGMFGKDSGSNVRIVESKNDVYEIGKNAKYYDEVVEVPFLNTTIPVPNGYLEILKNK